MGIKHLMMASCVFTAFAMQSCIKEKDLHQEAPATYSELNLKLEGDYLSTEMPMARSVAPTAIDENKTIVGIAISMIPQDVPNAASKPYAYGIFELAKAKNPDNLRIRVLDGYMYRISCTMIANAKDSILTENDGGFAAPFDLERTGKFSGKCSNKFLLADQVDGTKFLYNIENTKIKTVNGIQNELSRPFIERYHGLIDKLSVIDGMDNSIKLYRRFFGVQFKQTGLESGRLRIELDDAPKIYLNSSADIHETMESELKMVSMKNLTANLPGNNQPLTENVKVKVYWERTPGTEGELIVDKNFTFKRNYTHKLALTNIEHIGTPGNIGIEIEEGEMEEDNEQDIPWQG